MKRIILFLFFLLAYHYSNAQAPTDDSTKYIWYKYQYGLRQPRIAADSFIHVPYGDTTGRRPFRPGAIMMHTNKIIYKWDGTIWVNSGDGLNLQQVTDNGNKTLDTVIAKGIRTNDILPDTLNEDDFEIMVLPDLQYQTMTGIPGNCTIPDSSLVGNTFNWICANKTSTNLQAVLQVGDLTDDGNVSQMQRVDSNYDKFDNNNIRYLYVLGNHDYVGGSPTDARTITHYETYMGAARFSGKPYYGGNYDGTNSNYYISFDVGRKKFLVIGLEFQPRDAVIVWAQSILDANTDRETIIVTHALITGWGEKSKDTSTATNYGLTDNNNGTELWNKLIRKNKQIIMTLNGHYGRCCGGGCASLLLTSLGDPVDQRLTQTGDNGNIVHMLAYNHQSDSLGGAGHIMRMKFKPSESKIDISFFNARYEGNDPRRPSYLLYYPPVKVDGSLGVKSQFNVAGEATFDSTVKVTKLPANRPLVTGINGTLDSIPGADSSYVLVSQGRNKPPRYDTLPANSNAYIKNILPVAAATTGFQTGNFWIKGSGVVGGPSGTFGLYNGTPATFYVSHQNGSFGLGVQRAAGSNSSGPNFSFAHTYGSDWSSPAAVGLGAELGNIRYFGTATDLTLRVAWRMKCNVQKVGSNFVAAHHVFEGVDTTGVNSTLMVLTPWRTVGIGSAVFPLMQDKLTVFGTMKVTDTFKLPNILTKDDTTNYKPVVIDADGSAFKMAGWPIGANFFNTDLTQTVNRSHNAAGFTITIDSAKTYNFISRGLNFQSKKRHNQLFMDATNSQDLNDFMYLKHVWRKGADDGDSAYQQLVYNGNSGLKLESVNNIIGSFARLILNGSVATLTAKDSIALRGVPAATSDSIFAVGSFNAATQSNVAYKIPRLPYKVYTAFLNQSGTSNPTATVLENTIGSIVWTRNDVGDYTGTLTGAFTAGKTFIMVSNYSYDVEGAILQIQLERVDDNTVTLQVAVAGNKADGNLIGDGLPIEIRVYP